LGNIKLIKEDRYLTISGGEEFDAECELEVRSYHLYKQRFVNNIKYFKDTLSYIFNNESDEANLLFRYCEIKYNYLTQEYTMDELIATLVEFLKNQEYQELLNTYIEKNFVKSEGEVKKSNDELYLNDDHCKSIQRIAFSIRFVTPLFSDFLRLTKIYGSDDVYFKLYYRIADELYNECNIISKLHKFVESRVKSTIYSDSKIWSYLSSVSKDVNNSIMDIFEKILTLIIYKLEPKHRPISFLHVGVKNQLSFKFRENFAIKFFPVVIQEKDEENITNYNKFEIELIRNDEGKTILLNFNKKESIRRIKDTYGIEINRAEVLEFSKIKVDKFKVNLALLYFYKHFGSYDSFSLTKLELSYLLLLFKKILEFKGYNNLAQIYDSHLVVKNKKKVNFNKE